MHHRSIVDEDVPHDSAQAALAADANEKLYKACANALSLPRIFDQNRKFCVVAKRIFEETCNR